MTDVFLNIFNSPKHACTFLLVMLQYMSTSNEQAR